MYVATGSYSYLFPVIQLAKSYTHQLARSRIMSHNPFRDYLDDDRSDLAPLRRVSSSAEMSTFGYSPYVQRYVPLRC